MILGDDQTLRLSVTVVHAARAVREVRGLAEVALCNRSERATAVRDNHHREDRDGRKS